MEKRYLVDMSNGQISDADAEDAPSIWSPYRNLFVTRNALLAQAISDDINQEKIRDLQASIAANTALLNKLTGKV